MGTDTLRKIRKAEEEKAAKLKSARAEAERILARAAKASASIIAGAKDEAEARVAALKAQKVSEGKAEAEKILAANAKELQRMTLAAEKNVDKAAGLVLDRVCS